MYELLRHAYGIQPTSRTFKRAYKDARTMPDNDPRLTEALERGQRELASLFYAWQAHQDKDAARVDQRMESDVAAREQAVLAAHKAFKAYSDEYKAMVAFWRNVLDVGLARRPLPEPGQDGSGANHVKISDESRGWRQGKEQLVITNTYPTRHAILAATVADMAELTDRFNLDPTLAWEYRGTEFRAYHTGSWWCPSFLGPRVRLLKGDLPNWSDKSRGVVPVAPDVNWIVHPHDALPLDHDKLPELPDALRRAFSGAAQNADGLAVIEQFLLG